MYHRERMLQEAQPVRGGHAAANGSGHVHRDRTRRRIRPLCVPECRIDLIEVNNNSFTSTEAGVDKAVALGSNGDQQLIRRS